MSTQYICFCGEIRKINMWLLLLSGTLVLKVATQECHGINIGW